MFIKKVQLNNYRNYSKIEIEFSEQINFIIGKNAIGKTNLLESIYFLENKKSHRTNSYLDLIKWNEEITSIKATLKSYNREIIYEIIFKKNGGRIIKINGAPTILKQSDKEPVLTVLFTPDHLKIIKETPENRRSYLDEILDKTKPGYKYWRQKYLKILKQRNILLKRVLAGNIKDEVVEYWDKQLIGAGVKIILARNELINKIQKNSDEIFKDIIGNNNSNFNLKYENKQIINKADEKTIEETFSQQLKEARKEEILKGQTVIGPHRDDFIVMINDIDLRAFGSQGEQRLAALILKIAELKIITEITKEKPILLLDDVMSELDEDKRKALIKYISNDQQAIITSANEKYLEDINNKNDVKVIRI